MFASTVKKLTLISMLALAAGACSTLSTISGGGGDGGDFAAGSAFAERFSAADREALNAAFVEAMDAGKLQSWRGKRAIGAVDPGGFSLANLKPDPNERIAMARADIDINHVLETEFGLYVLTRNSNVRIGPGTDYKVAQMLPSGSGVEVVGRVVGEKWMLIASDGAVRGYVFQGLLTKAPGTELELAGGPRRAPVLCRAFTQRVSMSAERDEWSGAACRTPGGWRLAAEPAPPPAVDETADELDGY